MPVKPERGETRRAAYTMIELMLVVMIILLSSMIAIPSFVRSFRGARLRASARSVVMTHRHARSLAVLHQKHVAILFDTEKNLLELVVAKSSGGQASQFRFLDHAGPAGGGESVNVEAESLRYLAQNIRMTEFVLGEEDQDIDGIYYVNYYPSGGCDKFSFRLVDERGRHVRIKADPHSGNITAKEK